MNSLDRWSALPDGAVVDVDGAMLATSLEIVGDTLFSANLQDSAPELVAAVITALDHVIARSRNPVISWLNLTCLTARGSHCLATKPLV